MPCECVWFAVRVVSRSADRKLNSTLCCYVLQERKGLNKNNDWQISRPQISKKLSKLSLIRLKLNNPACNNQTLTTMTLELGQEFRFFLHYQVRQLDPSGKNQTFAFKFLNILLSFFSSSAYLLHVKYCFPIGQNNPVVEGELSKLGWHYWLHSLRNHANKMANRPAFKS